MTKFVLTMELDVELEGEDENFIKSNLKSGINHMFNEGWFTGSSNAYVANHSVAIEVGEFRYASIKSMREAGFAIVTFSPDELRGALRERVENRLVELGNEVIDTMAPEEDQDE